LSAVKNRSTQLIVLALCLGKSEQNHTFSEELSMRAHAMHSQAEIDAIFADYDTARLPLCDDEVCSGRNTLSCAGCGGLVYTFNNFGNEAGTRVCSDCGVVAPGHVIFETMFGRVITTKSSNYKRIHHWHERISQLMLLESKIPAADMLRIGEKLLDGTYAVLNKDVIRHVLRSLGKQVYIEKWLQIIERCTGINPPCPGPIVLMQLDELFTELQRPFAHFKIGKRRNFLNYNYVFCRLFQKMGCTKFCMFFPLIRSKVKLRQLDALWQLMAENLGWECPLLEVVPSFAVRIGACDALLDQLRLKVERSEQAAMQRVPFGMEHRRWGHRVSIAYKPSTKSHRSVRPEPQIQTIALKLERRRSALA